MQTEVVKKIAEQMAGVSFNNIKAVLGGRNSHIFRLDNGSDSYALKFFRQNANNTRNRFEAETSALKLFAQNSIQCVPKLIGQDRENNCVLLEWIHGKPINNYTQDDIHQLSGFVKKVHDISRELEVDDIRFATDACLNGSEIVLQINRRFERLKTAGDTYPELQHFLEDNFIPALQKITCWSQREFLKRGMDFDVNISQKQMTLSLVDIGFHNCLRIKNSLYFLDFEFFGRDDPVKLVADTLQHPGSMLEPKDTKQLEYKLHSIFNDDQQFLIRMKCLYPLFGLKWCMIMLNPFLHDYVLKDIEKNKIQKDQLLRVITKTLNLVKMIKNHN